MDNVTVQDNHRYYTSMYYPPSSQKARDLWVELSGADGVEVDDFDDTASESVLSGLHRYYEVMTYYQLHVHV